MAHYLSSQRLVGIDIYRDKDNLIRGEGGGEAGVFDIRYAGGRFGSRPEVDQHVSAAQAVKGDIRAGGLQLQGRSLLAYLNVAADTGYGRRQEESRCGEKRKREC